MGVRLCVPEGETMNERVEAGRETDMRVAEEVLGWGNLLAVGATVWGSPPGASYDTNLPYFSERPDSALLVVEALRVRGWLVTLKAMPDGFPFLAGNSDEQIRARYVAEAMWMPCRTAEETRRKIQARLVGLADTLALAVCRCALAAVAAEKGAER